MDLVPQFTKRDLNKSPTFEDLGRAYATLLPFFQQSDFNFKIIGGYACHLFGSRRDTKDLDFVFDLDSKENVCDVMVSMQIPNLYPLGAGGGFGYLLPPSNLVEVNVLDKRLFQSLQLIPNSIWKIKDPILPIEWMLFIKLRTWGARSMRVAPIPVGGKDRAKTDAVDVTNLVDLAIERNVSVPSFVIKETMEIITRFIVRQPNSKAKFQALGYSV